MGSECAHVVTVDGECVDCRAAVDRADGAERWFSKPGECVGCGRAVKNGFTRGKGVACINCLWPVWGGGAAE
jgi:hypothetical protein